MLIVLAILHGISSRLLACAVSFYEGYSYISLDSPIEVVIGSVFLYNLLGVSALIGLAVTCLFLPMNHYAGKVVVSVQENLMKTRDERVSLMNEVHSSIFGDFRTEQF